MGKSSRNKRRTYQSPKKARTGNNTLWYALAFVIVVGGVLAVALSRSKSASSIGPLASRGDHWHAALGVDDCGTWVQNWAWPPGNTSQGVPARAGSGGQLYAGMHSHGDGLIHMEPQTGEDEGNNATVGRYFKYGGWKLSETSIKFVNVDEKNGNQCNGKPGVLRWAVNGKEMHGNPASYKLFDGDAVELVFTTKDAKLPPKTDIPSFSTLESVLNGAPSEGAPTAPGETQPGVTTPGATQPGSTTPGATSPSAPTSAPTATTTGAPASPTP
jgi:hypothetical protein